MRNPQLTLCKFLDLQRDLCVQTLSHYQLSYLNLAPPRFQIRTPTAFLRATERFPCPQPSTILSREFTTAELHTPSEETPNPQTRIQWQACLLVSHHNKIYFDR